MKQMKQEMCHWIARVAGLALIAWGIAGCGNGGGGIAAVGISDLNQPGTQAVTLDAGMVLPVGVSVVNDVAHQGANILLSGAGSLGPVSFTTSSSATQETLSYIAPAQATAGTTAVITASSIRTPTPTAILTISLNPALILSAATLPNGTVASAYNASLSATGGTGTYKWTVSSGALPTGLTLSPTTGAISGSPTVAGTYIFTVTVSDSLTPIAGTASQSYTITIVPTPPKVTTTSLPNAVVGTAYSQQLTYTGGGAGTVTWVINGALPAGLTLNAATGVISGTATTASAGAVYSFTAAVTIGSQTSPAVSLAITVPALPAVSTTTLPSGNIGVPYSQQLAYTGGAGGTVSWALTGTLPSGLAFNTATGVISGTPKVATSATFSVTVTVGAQTSVPQALTLVINSLVVTSGSAANGEIGLAFRFGLTVAGGTGPYTWSLASGSAPLPAGLTLNASTGVISGLPTTVATTNVTVLVTDSLGATATQAMSITISAARVAALNAELTGQYAFLLNGVDSTGHPLAAAGKFTADGNGNILSGLMDVNGTGMASPQLNAALLPSAYVVGADGRGKIALVTASASYTFVLAVSGVTSGVGATGFLTELDATGQRLTGALALQTTSAFTTASFAGGYAFGLSGFAGGGTSAALQHRAVAGEIQFNGTGSSTSAEYLSSAVASTTPVTPTATAIVIASTGRGTLSLTTSSGSLNFVVYVVSASKLFLMSTTAAGNSAADLLSGQALQQTVANGNFAATSLNGNSILRLEKVASSASGTPTATVQLGVAAGNGAGKMTFSADQNAAGVASSLSLTGTYTVAANGRVTFALSAGLGGCADCVSAQTFAYLVGSNQGFVMDFSSGAAAGYLEPVSVTTFANSALSGSYAVGTLRPLTATVNEISGTDSFNGAGVLNGTQDQTTSTANLPDGTVSASYSVGSAGRTVITSSSGATSALYLVSPTKSVSVDLGAASPLLQEWLHQ